MCQFLCDAIFEAIGIPSLPLNWKIMQQQQQHFVKDKSGESDLAFEKIAQADHG